MKEQRRYENTKWENTKRTDESKIKEVRGEPQEE